MTEVVDEGTRAGPALSLFHAFLVLGNVLTSLGLRVFLCRARGWDY